MRIQLDLDEYGMTIIKRLMDSTGSNTYKELFNNAVTLLDWAVNQRRSGRRVASVDETRKEYRELQMPALERSAAQNTAQTTAASATG